MEEQINLLWNKMKEEFQKQTDAINQTVQNTITTTIEAKLTTITEETEKLKAENTILKSKIKNLEAISKKNNVIIHGIEEKENNNTELLTSVLEALNSSDNKQKGTEWDKWEVSKVERLGKKTEKKHRPIKITLTLEWRKIELLRNRKSYPKNLKITEDFTKEILEERKALIPKLIEAREAGKYAILKQDKLIIKEKNEHQTEKRKRLPSSPPSTPPNNFNNPEKQDKINQPAKQTKITHAFHSQSKN